MHVNLNECYSRLKSVQCAKTGRLPAWIVRRHVNRERELKYSAGVLRIDDLGGCMYFLCAGLSSLIYYCYIICEGSFEDVIALQESDIKLQESPIFRMPNAGDITLLFE